MTPQPVARYLAAVEQSMQPFMEAIGLVSSVRAGDEVVCDFFAGNPQELALPGLVAALVRWSVPQDKEWFAYKMADIPAQTAAAEGLSRRLDMPFESKYIHLTRGATGALAVSMRTVVDPGDEIIFISPPWFFYEAMILAAGATPIRVRVDPDTFDLDLDAIAAAITVRTRAVIVNTPNNPTGRIYGPDSLQGLAAILTQASQRYGRPIYIIADQSYDRVIFDQRRFHSPGHYYPWSFLIETYSKSALAPGQRLGFVALPLTMPDREQVRSAMLLASFGHGQNLPDAVMQYALPEVDALSIDMAHLQRKRDRMVRELRKLGYELHVPEGTFYLLPRSPIHDDFEFARRLAERGVLVLPGKTVEMPGHFRLSLTATDSMIDRALPIFAEAVDGHPESIPTRGGTSVPAVNATPAPTHPE